MRHISTFPDDLDWKPCIHRATEQMYAVLTEDTAVETIHGTMTGRKGDCIMKGADEETLYILTLAAFLRVYLDVIK